MLPPDQDEAERRPIWDALQNFWLDTDPMIFFAQISERCAHSKYSIDELEQIYWNEVRRALWIPMWPAIGEWAGYEINWLSEQILKKHRYGKPIPMKILHPHANHWWKKLAAEIERVRGVSV
jgi:hypothetical protein